MAAAAAATAASKPPLPDLPVLPPPLRQDPNQTLQLLLFAALACNIDTQRLYAWKSIYAAAADIHDDGMSRVVTVRLSGADMT